MIDRVGKIQKMSSSRCKEWEGKRAFLLRAKTYVRTYERTTPIPTYDARTPQDKIFIMYVWFTTYTYVYSSTRRKSYFIRFLFSVIAAASAWTKRWTDGRRGNLASWFFLLGGIYIFIFPPSLLKHFPSRVGDCYLIASWHRIWQTWFNVFFPC